MKQLVAPVKVLGGEKCRFTCCHGPADVNNQTHTSEVCRQQLKVPPPPDDRFVVGIASIISRIVPSIAAGPSGHIKNLHVVFNSSIPGESEMGSVERSCRSSFIHQLIPWPICSSSEWEAEEISHGANGGRGSFPHTDALLQQVKHLVVVKRTIQNHQDPTPGGRRAGSRTSSGA